VPSCSAACRELDLASKCHGARVPTTPGCATRSDPPRRFPFDSTRPTQPPVACR
jgi:hypothetical protein